jgi:hypothetical protein
MNDEFSRIIHKFSMNSEPDNSLTNSLLQKLYVVCAPVYDSPVYFYTHWVNAHIVWNREPNPLIHLKN